MLVGVYGGQQGITALTVISVGLNLMTLAAGRRLPGADWPRATRLIAWYLPGAVLGALLLKVASPTLLELLITVGVFAAILTRLLPALAALRLPMAPAGLLAGAFGMSTGVSGPPFIVHLLHEGLPPQRMRATLAAIFLVTAALGLVILVAVGAFSLPGAIAVLLAATAAGHLLGRRVFARLSPGGYERLVLATMGASAVATLALLAT